MGWPKKKDKHGCSLTMYDPSMCEEIVEMGKQGCHDYQIASRLGISRCSLWRWTKKFPEFKQALQEARSHATAYIIDITLGNLTSRDFQSRAAEMLLKVHRDVEQAQACQLPELKTAPTLAAKAHVIIDALADQRVDAENARLMMESIRSAVIIEQEIEVIPALKNLEAQINLLEHKK